MGKGRVTAWSAATSRVPPAPLLRKQVALPYQLINRATYQLPRWPIFAQILNVIAIDNVLVSDDVVEAQFICDLAKCKGGCCEDGDAGAPLEKDELQMIKENYHAFEPYLSPEGKAEIARQGQYIYDTEFGWVTPTINGGLCAYGFHDEHGIIKCGIEAAYLEGKLNWKKPISCHLFPIRVTQEKEYTMVNYEPRETLCKPGCALGKKAKMPVYQFLQEPIERRFGKEFYDTLHAVAVEHFDKKAKAKNV